MAITFRSETGASGTGNFTPTKPTGTTTDDLLILHVCFEKGTDVSFGGAGDAQWTWIDRADNSTNIGIRVGYRKEDGTSLSQVNLAGGPKYTWTVARYDGQDTTDPLDQNANANSASGNPDPPSISPVEADTLVIAVVGNKKAPTGTAPSGYTERWDRANTAAGLSWTWGGEKQLTGTPGSENPAAVVPSETEAWGAITFNLIPASTGTTVEGSFTAAAVIKAGQSGSLTAAAILLDTIAGSLTADALLLATSEASLTADALVLAAVSASTTADAIVTGGVSASTTIDAVLQREQTGTFTADAWLEETVAGSLTADAVLFATVGASYPADAIVQGAQSASFQAAAIKFDDVPGTDGAFSADAVIFGTVEASLTADAVTLAAQSGSTTLDAVVLDSTSDTFAADAVILATLTASLTADAVLLSTETASLTADAVIAETIEGSLTADAFVQPYFFADAVIGSTAGFTADAVIDYVGRAVWTTPADQVTMPNQPTLAFLMPEASGNMHFRIEIDEDNGFGSPTVYQSPGAGWEYWDGDSWESIPDSGVPNTFAGNEARYTVQSALPVGVYYRRVRAGTIG